MYIYLVRLRTRPPPEGDLTSPPLSSPLRVPDVTPEPKALFCRLRGLGVPPSHTPRPFTPPLPSESHLVSRDLRPGLRMQPRVG